MKAKSMVIGTSVVLLSGIMVSTVTSSAENSKNYSQPPIVAPGKETGLAPSDAIILFYGKDLSRWSDDKGRPAKWRVANGYMEINGTGNIRTRQPFGDYQLHIEWAVPRRATGSSSHGNSGIFLMGGRFELQVYDSYRNINQIKPEHQAASLFGHKPPLVNACRGNEIWQSYEIIFRRPKLNQNNKMTRPGRITIFHNGVLVQDNFEFTGNRSDEYPIILQDHGDIVRYRNIWIRELSND